MMATSARATETFEPREGLHYYSTPLKVISGKKFGLYSCTSSLSTEMSSSESLPAADSVVDSPPAVSGAQRAREKAKDKRQGKGAQAPKGKTAKEKRKLREKRRPTGVIRIPPPNGSTGDSFEDDSEPATSSFELEELRSPSLVGSDGELGRESEEGSTPVIIVQNVSFPSDKDTSDDADEEDNDGNLLTIPPEVDPVVPPISAAEARGSHMSNPRLSSLVRRYEESESQAASYLASRQSEDDSPSPREAHPAAHRLNQGNTQIPLSSAAETNNNSTVDQSEELAECNKHIAELNQQNAALQKLVEKIQSEALSQKLALQRALREREEEASILSDRALCQQVEIRELTEELQILDKDLEQLDEDNMNLVDENKTLLRTLHSISNH